MSGWIGVDFDGTLAEHSKINSGMLGEPVPAMISKIKRWLEKGIEVRILTARVGSINGPEHVAEQRRIIELWCLQHIGRALPVTAEKDYGMITLYDDRARHIRINEGVVCCDCEA